MRRFMNSFLCCAVCLACVSFAPLSAQATFTLSLNAPHPASLNTGPTGTTAVLTNIVRTEALQLSLSSTASAGPGGQLLPRRISLWIGAEAVAPTLFPEGPVFLALGGTPPATLLFDSFSMPWAPMFSGVPGSTSTIPLNLGAHLFGPLWGVPLPTLVLQGYCDDIPGNPLLISNAVRLNVIDPAAAGFEPSLSNLSPQFASGTGVVRPSGPETGGSVVTLSGTNFLPQSTWISHPPEILFGGVPVTVMQVLSANSLMVLAPPRPQPTNPPFTTAGLVDVTYRNHNGISPAGSLHPAPMQYLYLSGVTPVVVGINDLFLPPVGGVWRTLQGSGFLNGASVNIRSASNPSLTWTQVVAPGNVGAGGTTITFVWPTFCSGPVEVRVTNVDEVVSLPLVVNVWEQPPVLSGGGPLSTLSPALGGGAHLVLNEVSHPLTLSGSGYLTATSPLATAATVPPGTFYPTRALLEGVQITAVAPISAGVMLGTWPGHVSSGLVRPENGVRTLSLENPPCVANGNVTPITSAPCAPGTPCSTSLAICSVLVRDDQPPVVTSLFPRIIPASGCRELRIFGSNFFSTEYGTTTADYSGCANGAGVINTLSLANMRIPAVLFGDRFAPRVTLVSETELLVEAPAQVVSTSTPFTVQVFNPDGRDATVLGQLTVAPDFVDTSVITAPASLPQLDEVALQLLATGMVLPGVNPGDAPALALVANPAPQADRFADTFASTLPANTNYEFILLFNTRNGDGTARQFFFEEIDLPATFTLPYPGLVADPALDATQPAGLTRVVPANVPLRVIVKAAGFSRDAGGRFVFEPVGNHALVLASHDRFASAALMNLDGGALVPEALQSSQPWRTRVEQTFAPAGAGRGGRGGRPGPPAQLTLPAPAFALLATALAGYAGDVPADRVTILPALATQGFGGTAAAPFGFQSGGGGGGGYASVGANGLSASVPGGGGGSYFGNSTPSPIVAGTPILDCFIYGSTAADFASLGGGDGIGTGKLFGGSGGGGGGGATALFVPAQSMGGRGGNGGGALVLLANCVMELSAGAVLRCNGEAGQIGLDVFPVAGAGPVLPVCIPGTGGGGSGGTILVCALAHICLPGAGPTACAPTAPVVTLTSPFCLANGGTTVPAQAGALSGPAAFGGFGRLRFAIRDNSPHAPDLALRLAALWSQGFVLPAPTCPTGSPLTHLWPGS